MKLHCCPTYQVAFLFAKSFSTDQLCFLLDLPNFNVCMRIFRHELSPQKCLPCTPNVSHYRKKVPMRFIATAKKSVVILRSKISSILRRKNNLAVTKFIRIKTSDEIHRKQKKRMTSSDCLNPSAVWTSKWTPRFPRFGLLELNSPRHR